MLCDELLLYTRTADNLSGWTIIFYITFHKIFFSTLPIYCWTHLYKYICKYQKCTHTYVYVWSYSINVAYLRRYITDFDEILFISLLYHELWESITIVYIFSLYSLRWIRLGHATYVREILELSGIFVVFCSFFRNYLSFVFIIKCAKINSKNRNTEKVIATSNLFQLQFSIPTSDGKFPFSSLKYITRFHLFSTYPTFFWFWTY